MGVPELSDEEREMAEYVKTRRKNDPSRDIVRRAMSIYFDLKPGSI